MRRSQLAAFVLAATVATACASHLPQGGASARPEPEPTEPRSVERLHALILNGGGRPAINYQSHLLHVEQLLSVLGQAGVAADRISVFSGDGEDPGADLAVRTWQPDDEFWRVQGTPLAGLLRPVRFITSSIDGVTLQPATREALAAWFAEASQRLEAGDTLLLYVTDHGERNREDLTNNTITLWGEHISVTELRELLAQLEPSVRVVALMSQCFSGSFYGTTRTRTTDTGDPDGSVCGYYASTAARPAYGCYPESRGRDNVGHSFHFFQSLAEDGRFIAAHESTLVTDATPDVPLRSSDLYLREQLAQAARDRGIPTHRLADELLTLAWNDQRRWEPQLRLLDRIGAAFGFFSPRSWAELEDQRRTIPATARHLRQVARAWRETLGDANRAEVERFFEEHPTWRDQTQRDRVAELEPEELATLARSLAEAMARFAAGHPETDARLRELHSRERAAAAAAFRMEVRLAAVLRMRMTLLQVAGTVYLERYGTPEQRTAHAALVACEDLRIPGDLELPELSMPQEFPPLADDIATATAALPAWIGIRFREVESELRPGLGLAPGASRVLTVFPNSPAESAGLSTGDILIGPPGRPFEQHREVRWWTMLAEPGTARRLEILRGEQRQAIDIVPGLYPVEWPSLPGPPAPGDAAPPLRLLPIDGDLPALAPNHILFFWATWCPPCRAAVPALREFAAANDLQVVAISDEPRATIAAYVKKAESFPEFVAIDEFRQTFHAYGVSGTPTFVWIEAGTIRAVASGYSATDGIRWVPPTP